MVSGYPDDWPELDRAGWSRTLVSVRSGCFHPGVNPTRSGLDELRPR